MVPWILGSNFAKALPFMLSKAEIFYALSLRLQASAFRGVTPFGLVDAGLRRVLAKEAVCRETKELAVRSRCSVRKNATDRWVYGGTDDVHTYHIVYVP